MNIRRIITEAINNTILSRYADELRNIVGTRGIDTSQVQNNQALVVHIEDLNDFIFRVLNAIDEEYYTVEDGVQTIGGGGYSNGRSSSIYNDRGQRVSRGIGGLVNYTANKAGEAYDTLGLNKALPFLNGSLAAATSAYNQTKGATDDAMFQHSMNKRYNNSGSGGAATFNKTTGGAINSQEPLSDLLNIDGVKVNNPSASYVTLYNQATQLNQQSGGALFSIREVKDCYRILNEIRNEVHRIVINRRNQNNQQQTQQGQQQQGQQQTQQGQQQTQQGQRTSTNGSNQQPNYTAYLNKLINYDTNGRWLHNYLDTIDREVTDENTHDTFTILFKNIAKLCEYCITALENVIREPNNRNNLSTLLELMSIPGYAKSDDYFHDVYSCYYTEHEYNGKYLDKFKKINDMADTLFSLYKELRTCFPKPNRTATNT